MNKPKSEDLLIDQTPELPAIAPTHLVQAEVDEKLFLAVKAEIGRGKKRVKLKEVISWGLRAYLLRVNPRAAKQLGIVSEK